MFAHDRAEPWYAAEDAVPESMLHLLIRTTLWALIRRHLAEQGVRAFVGSEQFVYWKQGNPVRRLAPDVYVAIGHDPHADVRVWKTWEQGPLQLAIEIVSDDVQKDYALAPARYDELGVDELIVFDPFAGDAGSRVAWQVWRRGPDGLAEVERHDGDRVASVVLGCHLRAVPSEDDGRVRVRPATGPAGDVLVPSEAEALRAELEALRRQLAGS